jgi:hypothetical protein
MNASKRFQVTHFYHYLLGASVVTRWFLFITPILGLLWIPVRINLALDTDKPSQLTARSGNPWFDGISPWTYLVYVPPLLEHLV